MITRRTGREGPAGAVGLGGCAWAGGGVTFVGKGAIACGGAAGAGGRAEGGVTTTSDGGGAAASGVGAAGGAACGSGGAAGAMTGGAITGRRTGGGGAVGAAGRAATGGGDGAAGAAARGGTAVAGRAAATCVVCWIAFSTSPGLEICERSNLGLISSAPRRPARVSLPAPAGASRCAVKCCRTFSASSASIELEWVFFSVTPREGRSSRISLLLTSSSLARSLIRTFGCIRPVFLRISVKSSSQPHGFSG